jgi:threonine dehydratase
MDFERAKTLLQPLVRETPLRPTEIPGLFLKCEHEQLTGSFKVRGALNKVLQLSYEERGRGLVAASAGNHGLGVAYAALKTHAKATIVVPDDAVQPKVDGIRALGGEVIAVPGGFGAAEARGRELAEERQAVWVSPYNDLLVIEGQGTLGLEIDHQLKSASDERGACEVYVPVSGGGLACGVGLALKEVGAYRVVGVQTSAAPYMAAFYSGDDPETVRETPTLADGLAGPVERGSVTFDLLRDALDDMRVVSEAELREALELAWREFGVLVEPSAAVPLAAALKIDGDRRRVVILSGGNLAPQLEMAVKAGTLGKLRL